jgi:fibronectin type 3 domain-containing protein
MKLLTVSTLCAASLLLLSGCAELNLKKEKKVVIDNTLPKVVLTKNGVITDMKTVAFEWKSVQDPRVKEIYIYKRSADTKVQNKLDFYDSINNRYATHYVDRDVEPGSVYSYAFRVVSDDAQGRLSQTHSVKTRPVLGSVSWIHSIAGLPRMAKILWRPHVSERVAAYIIERRAVEENKWSKLTELQGRLNAEYIDEGLQDNHVYFYRIKVKTYDDIVSPSSKVVKVVTKPLPKSIDNISASKDLPKAIKVTWSATNIKDFQHYNLYRSEDVDGSYELIAQLHNNSYTDKIDEDGKVYFYKVSVVDKDGLESPYDNKTAMGMSLPKPKAPIITEAKFMGSRIELKWDKSDARVEHYIVVRKAKKGWFDEKKQEFKGIKTNFFIDEGIAPDTLYKYIVYGVDGHGLVSKPSTEIQIKTPESNEIVEAKKTKEQTNFISEPVQKKKSTETPTTVSPIEDLDLNEI